MTFEQLRALLVTRGQNPLAVICSDHDSAELLVRAPSDAWVIWNHDGHSDVGASERGRFVLTGRFDSEQQACDYLAGVLAPAPVAPQTAQQNAHSAAVTSDFEQRMQQLLAQQGDD